MRFRTLRKWDDLEGTEALLFCAQMLEELLFDYTLDTYKPSAMNASLLCSEALMCAADIEKGLIDKNNLKYIIEELSQVIRRDPVVKRLLSLDVDSVLRSIEGGHERIADKKVVLELVAYELSLKRYKEMNESLLSEVVKANGRKSDIRVVVRSYVTTLINFGYESKYLYKKCLDFFYYGSERIKGNHNIDDFIDIFKKEPDEYVAIYKASGIFSVISDSCENIDINVSKGADDYSGFISSSGFSNITSDQVYVVVKGISALDMYAAKAMAEDRMEVMSTLMKLFHHKERPDWEGRCLMVNESKGTGVIVDIPVNTMHRCIDLKPEKASLKLNQLINGFSLHQGSFTKFARSAELHSLALDSDSRENQMINLWIALESLIPSSAKELSKIQKLIDAIMPFINIVYVQRLVERFVADLFNWSPAALNRAVKGIPGGKIYVKIAKVLTQEEFKGRREKLFQDFGDFVLLRNRAFQIGEMISKGSKVSETIKIHDQRVRWQIRRIYRSRNMIVHSGVTLSFTDILIENLHDYLDIVMSKLVALASGEVNINTIDQGFKYVAINYESYLKFLDKNKDGFSNESIEKLFLR
ncbi:hypothetical protein [Alcanivorax sp.]|uniref:hypothetical protein n=1 Tax=Alcanivorax sp. TaxID=1872427 RepID=UPI0025BD1050|nr:hypothetical protein [Alcanivorax sp.]